ncbi:MAG: electron transport complex subunit RsxE [Planctomycetes bacterium]|nr:electron transport complex subunit RsxE [Planctomycetota bacterium]MBU1518729.1 electron transport complex subunit RsxE [Planctomycetota bacterium]MBU2457618.1 electron transport complex subunit RsxE [Planctomycetota bacterium]MBU2596784.1 electron transport complex subunit RsxE [Planctomycetota bacterium]
MENKAPTVSNVFTAGLWRENPILRLLLGMCPTLAVTTAVKPALTMGLSVIFVLLCSNIVVSLMRKLLKPHLRILMFTLAIATFVTIADLFLKAFQPEMSAVLGPYVPLIIVNCIIICRAEACASKNGLFVSVIDAIGMGIGFTVVLCILGGIRELLATGMIFDIPVMWKGFMPLSAMRMPVGAFITLGLILGLVNMLTAKKS